MRAGRRQGEGESGTRETGLVHMYTCNQHDCTHRGVGTAHVYVCIYMGTLLTLAHAREGYCSWSVCLCVCEQVFSRAVSAVGT